MKRALVPGSAVLLALLAILLWRANPGSDRQPKNEELHVIPPPENGSLLNVWTGDAERWLAMGTVARDGRRRVWTLRGNDDGPEGSAALLPLESDAIIRAAEWLPDGRIVTAGEIAVPGSSGPLGHSLYRGLAVLLDGSARVVAQQALGPPGATGLRTVAVGAVGDGTIIAGGIKDSMGWLVALQADELSVLWERAKPEWSGFAAMVVDSHQIILGGEANARTVGLGRGFVLALDETTQARQWRWDAGAAAGSAITHVVRVAGGWMALGAIEEAGRRRVWLVALDEHGRERWQRTLPVEARVAGGCALVAVEPETVRAVICMARETERYATVLMDVATQDGTLLATRTVEEGPVRAYGLREQGGHRLGIDHIGGESPPQAMLLALDRELRVAWSVGALDSLESP